MIPKETEAEIVRLYHGEKWPIGTIAGQLGIHHTTVQRVLRQTGVDRKVFAPRPSMIDPYVPFVVEQLEKYPGLRARRLFVMIKERGYPGGPDHLRRLVGRLRPRKAAEAFQRLRTMQGEQAQVDCPRPANDTLRLIIGGRGRGATARPAYATPTAFLGVVESRGGRGDSPRPPV